MKKSGKLFTLALAACCCSGVALAAEDAIAVPAQLPGMTPAPAAAEAFSWDAVPEVVARIGDQEITRDQLKAYLANVLPGGEIPAGVPKEQAMMMLYNVAGLMGNMELLDMVLADMKLDDVKTQIRKFYDENLDEERKALLMAQLEQQGMTYDDFLAQMESNPELCMNVALLAIGSKLTEGEPAFTAEDAKKAYEENKMMFTEPGGVEVAHILIQPEKGKAKLSKEDAKAKMDELHAQVVANPDSFGDVAMANSDCPSAADGGKLGMPLSANTTNIDPVFLAASLPLEKGEISEVIETQFGYHIIMAVDKVEDQVEPYSPEIEEYLLRSLDIERKMNAAQASLKEFAEKHPVDVLLPAPEITPQMLGL